MKSVIEDKLDDLDEGFFVVLSGYIDMAEREESGVAEQLRGVYRAAQEAKERTQRPEIQLLNKLLRCKEHYEYTETIEANLTALTRDGGYFFKLIDYMRA